MIELLDLGGGITRVRMAHWRSRLVGYDVSAYLADGILIDTGFPAARGEFERLLAELRPRGVILTHQHEDHAGNLAAAARHGIPIAAAPDTLDALRRPQRLGWYRRFVWDPLPVFAGGAIPFEAHGLEMLHTPGHSPDHRVVWDAARGVLYAGDLFLGVKVRVARPGENPRALVASLRRAAALRPRVMLDAHRGPVADPAGSLLAKADWLEATIAAIETRLAAGADERTVAREVLGREDLVNLFTMGDLSRVNLVRAVRAGESEGRGVSSEE